MPRSLLLTLMLILRGFRNAELLPDYCQTLGSNRSREVRIGPLCDPHNEGSDNLEMFDGAIIGLDGTAVVTIPVSSNPPPLTSDFTWTGPDGRMIDVRSVVIQQDKDNNSSHLIVSIVEVADATDYGVYHVLYKDLALVNVAINKEDLKVVLFTEPSHGIARSSSLRFLITTMLSTFFGILLLSVVFLFCCCTKKDHTDHDKKGPYTETSVYEKSGSDPDYSFAITTVENNCYSTLDDTIQEHSL